MASGKQGEDTVSINLGGQWTDHTGSTENEVIVNNRINFIITKNSYVTTICS